MRKLVKRLNKYCYGCMQTTSQSRIGNDSNFKCSFCKYENQDHPHSIKQSESEEIKNPLFPSGLSV